jgi:hypothetical protein
MNKTKLRMEESWKTPMLERAECFQAIIKAQQEIVERAVAKGFSMESVRVRIVDENLHLDPEWSAGDTRVIGVMDFIFK